MSAVAVRQPRDDVCWLTAAPLWSAVSGAAEPAAGDLDRMRRPALLRLRSDDFMDELADLLGEDAERLAELEARPQGLRAPPPGADDGHEPPIDHVKLYQPAHGHFNLVAATLVCRLPGLPDKHVDLPATETAGFVVRRVSGDDERAWSGTGWVGVPSPPAALAEREQVLPLFPVVYGPAPDRRRRLLMGLLPAASAEVYERAARAPESPGRDKGPAVRCVVRCVYRRPRCGPLHPDVVSDASAPFALASLLDPDAPARPVHVALGAEG